ncbi:MAG: hypothetical protein HC836_30370 [Richelia sp. RM2_1_2]|nr:hypothetical protein [Richelia sp. RM2_1_2]
MIQPRLEKAEPAGVIAKDKTHITIFYYDEYPICWYILSDLQKSSIFGYVMLEHVSNNIWQVRDAVVTESGKGLGTNLYYFIVRTGNNLKHVQTKKLIHDEQLSPAAEQLWKKNLVKKGLVRKIYDRQLDQIYPENSIGSALADGTIILNPEEDTVRLELGEHLSDIRFFWLVESITAQPNIHPLRNRFFDEGLSDFLYESVIQGIKNKDKKIGSWIWFAFNDADIDDF